MQLVEAHRVDLDAPVQKYLPWFQVADQNASGQITIRHLLNQTSGLSEKESNHVWSSPAGLEEEVRMLNSISLTFPVGSRFQYSNINYIIAGLIVETVSGQSYADYVTQNIFQPLAMTKATASRERALADGLAEGYYYCLGYPRPGVGPLPPANLPTGLLIASVEDMVHYLIAQLNDGRYHNESILSPQGMATLHKPVAPMPMKDFHYAMGWAVGPIDGELTIRHAGDTGYFHSAIIMQPGKNWGVVALANASGFVQIRQLDVITRNILRILNGLAPLRVTMPFMMRSLYWIVLLMPILLIAGIGYGFLQWSSGAKTPLSQIALTALVYVSIASFFLFRLPGVIPFSLKSMRFFYPELAYAMIASGVLGFGWSIIYLLLGITEWKPY